MRLESYSRSSKIQSPFERVLPDYVRKELSKRPQVDAKYPIVAAKTPKVAAKRPQVADRSALWTLAGAAVLLGTVAILSVTQTPVSVTQALPTPIPRLPTPSPAPTVVVAEAPRAELLHLPAPRARLVALPTWRVGRQQLVQMPDGLQVLATLKGSVFSASQLPTTGNHIGDTYVLGDNSEWVWLTPSGSTQATWIDP